MSKKRVLFLIWSFTAGGGAEKILANIVNNINYDKYEVSILEYKNFNIKREFVNEKVKIKNPIIIQNGSILNKIKNKILEYLTYKRPKILYDYYINGKYDIEIAFNYMIPSILISNSKAKKYTVVHSSIEDLDYTKALNEKYNKTKLKYQLQKHSFEKMNNIIAISNRTEKSIIDLYPEVSGKLVKIYNGYDFDNLYRKSKELSYELLNDKKFTLIAIGRLVEQKNFSFLIDIADKLNEEKLDYELLILGDGNQREQIEKKINRYNLTDKVKLLGYIENPYPYLKNADLFCLTSIAEGFPTVLVEALALGCPFISTNVAGAEELSDNGRCGIVANNINEYVFNIKKILNDKKLRDSMAKNGIKLVQKYSIENQIRQLEEIFDMEDM